MVALAVGTFNVITGVVVPVATDDVKSVPDVPIVNAATDVTVPTDKSPLPNIEPPLTVFILLPLTKALCLLLKLVQSVFPNKPEFVEEAYGILNVCTLEADKILKFVPDVPIANVCVVPV